MTSAPGAMAAANTLLQGGNRPNLLFILVDQWRFSAMSHGENHDSTVQTPNLDNFAKESVEWTRCYSAHPLCTPNRSAIITGRWPWETGMNTNNLMLPPNEKCIAHQFADKGYKTCYIGKWHMDGPAKPGFVPPGWRRRGFQTFIGFNRGHAYMNSKTFSNEGKLLQGWKGHYEPRKQTELAIDFIKKNKENPFFCFLSWGPPHTPYAAHPKQFSYNPKDIKLRPNVPGEARQKAAKSLSNYYAHCTALDDLFGKLMKELDSLGLKDNTLVVFTADHGDMHRSHNLLYKQHPQEESWHVPLIMRLPKVENSGAKTDTLISSADLMPTILPLCGLEIPSTCTGKDKSKAIFSKDSEAKDDSIYGGKDNTWRGVVKGDYKLVVENTKTEENNPTMLYNLKTDPYEMKNLIDDSKFKRKKEELLIELANWEKKTQDPFPKSPVNAKKKYAT